MADLSPEIVDEVEPSSKHSDKCVAQLIAGALNEGSITEAEMKRLLMVWKPSQ